MRIPVAVMVGWFGLAPLGAFAQDTWMSVMLDGQKVGQMHVTRDSQSAQVITTQSLDFRVSRLKTPMVIHTHVSTVESTAGGPLAFSSNGGQGTSATASTAQRRDDGVFQVDRTINAQSKVSLLQWPDGALLPEGQRLATVGHGFRPGAAYTLRVFEPSRQQVADLAVTVVGDEWVDLPAGREHLHHLKQVLAGSDGTQATELWVDDAGLVRRSISPLLAFHIEMAACNQACADAPDQAVDILSAAMVGAPQPLPVAVRVAPMRYAITVRGEHGMPFVNTDEQRVTDLGGGTYQVDVGYPPQFGSGGEPPPTDEDTAANPWVQSDAPEIRAMALQIVGDAQADGQRMRRLRSYLTYYINRTGLDVDYGAATETLRSRRGDCTEHAVLLAALARSLGIPTRIVSGLVYNDRFGGADHVFVPHAWVQAWLDGFWVSFDSAQGVYDTTHVAMAVGDGDPWRFFAATSTLGAITMQRTESMATGTATSLPTTVRPDYVRRALGDLVPSSRPGS